MFGCSEEKTYKNILHNFLEEQLKRKSVILSVMNTELFYKNDQGICYSVVTQHSFGNNNYYFSHTVVPCDRIQEDLILTKSSKGITQIIDGKKYTLPELPSN